MKKNIINSITVILIIVLGLSLSACSQKKQDDKTNLNKKSSEIEKLYGGNLPWYDVIYENEYESDEKSMDCYDFPLITDEKVTSFEYVSSELEGDGKDACIFRVEEFDPDEDIECNGKHINFFHMKIGINTKEAVNLKLTMMKVRLNGMPFDYPLENVMFRNVKGAFGEEYSVGEDLKYYISPVAVRQEFSKETESVGVEVYNDCTIGTYKIDNYVKIDDLKEYLNGEEITVSDATKVKEGDRVAYSFVVSGPDKELVRPARISTYITYEDKEGNKKVFLVPQGFCSYPLPEVSYVRNYVKQLEE